MYSQQLDLNHREQRLLRLVASGRVTISCSSEPALYVDGRYFCDQFAVYRVTSADLITTARAGNRYEVVPAQLTSLGWAYLHDELRTSLPPAA